MAQEADNDPTGEAAANTQQTLTFYELDLGLNHVVRKYSEALEEHGNFLITGEHRVGMINSDFWHQVRNWVSTGVPISFRTDGTYIFFFYFLISITSFDNVLE